MAEKELRRMSREELVATIFLPVLAHELSE